MKTLREAIEAAYKELWGDDLPERDFEVLQSYLAPLLAPQQDTRKAEVARIAEQLFIHQSILKMQSFHVAEEFVAYKESMQ